MPFMKSVNVFVAFVLALAFTLLKPAGAQLAPYAMFSAGHYSGQGVGPGTAPNQSGGLTAYGGTFGLYDNFLKLGPVKLGSDARFLIANSGNSTPYGNKLVGGLFGLRLDTGGVPLLPVNPYIQAEIGGVGTNNGTSPDRTGSFAYQVQVGGDFTILPHLDARVEYGTGQLTNINATNHTLQTFSAGLVLRLPKL